MLSDGDEYEYEDISSPSESESESDVEDSESDDDLLGGYAGDEPVVVDHRRVPRENKLDVDNCKWSRTNLPILLTYEEARRKREELCTTTTMKNNDVRHMHVIFSKNPRKGMIDDLGMVVFVKCSGARCQHCHGLSHKTEKSFWD